MIFLHRFLIAATLCGIATVYPLPALRAQQAPTDSLNPDIEAQVDQVLKQLTPEEKVDLVGGFGFMHTTSVDRLKICSLRMSDGPFGIRDTERADDLGKPSTVYMAGAGLAASWNPDLARKVGESFGHDARARGIHILLAPGMNLMRSPLAGRNFEYLGEDPILAGNTAVHFIQGVQSQGVAATMKHFACNEQEFDRDNISSEVDERTLRELYLKPFEMCVKRAHVWCAMDSYNLINGTHATADSWLNTTILKGEWGFKGLVMSDWWATHETLGCANGGLDLEMPGPPKFFNREQLLPMLASNLVKMEVLNDKVRRLLRMYFTMGWGQHPQLDPSFPKDNPVAGEVALEGAREGITLLKNQGGLLPFDLKKTTRIVILGHNADPAVAVGGGSAHANFFHSASLLDGLKAIVPHAEIIRIPWSSLPANTNFSVAPEKGKTPYALSAFGASGQNPIPDEYLSKIKEANLVIVCAGYNDNVTNSWDTLGSRPDEEHEAFDRTYELPPGQEAVILAAARRNPNTLVILNAGAGVSTEHWIDHVPMLIDAFYPGQYGGTALAEVIFGMVNPSGKLPFSWEKRWEDCAAFGNYPVSKVHQDNVYKEGVFIGYRWFDAKKISPLFPFGFGLSYTTFAYSNLKVIPEGDQFRVELTIENTGSRLGKESFQIYVEPPPGDEPRPVRELKAYGKVELAPGETKTMQATFPREDLAYWSSQLKSWVVSPGSYRIEAGSNSRDLALQTQINLGK